MIMAHTIVMIVSIFAIIRSPSNFPASIIACRFMSPDMTAATISAKVDAPI